MTMFQIVAMAAGIVFMLGAAIFAGCNAIDGAIRELARVIADEGNRDRGQRSELARTEMEWRQNWKPRQTVLPPAPVIDDSRVEAAMARATGRHR